MLAETVPFTGTWRGNEGDLRERFVLQCKHTTRSGRSLAAGDLSDDIDKTPRLSAAGRCDIYQTILPASLHVSLQMPFGR